MTKNEYKERVTPAIVRQVFEGNIIYPERQRWVMLLGGRIVAIQGKCFYESKQQAIKALYNNMSWKAKRELWWETHPDEDRYAYWRQPESSTMWRAFKEAIAEKYGFKVVPV